MVKPGPLQQAILAALRRNADRGRGGLTVRELAQAAYGLRTAEPSTMQTGDVHRAVQALARRGLVVKHKRLRARPIRDVIGGAVRHGEGTLYRGLKLGRVEAVVVTLAPDPDVCGMCGSAVVQPAVGRPRIWCSDRCRVARYHYNVNLRRRRARAAAD